MPTAQSLSSSTIEPLPGLESICNELLQEEGCVTSLSPFLNLIHSC